MNIAINCWVLRNKKLDGIGFFTVNTLPILIDDHPEVRFHILCDRNFNEDYFNFPNVTIYRIFPPFRHPLLYIPFMEVVVPFFLRRIKPDVFLSMEGFLSLLSSSKQIPVVYDINFEHRPEDMSFFNRYYFTFFFRRFVRKSFRIATISEYSKRDISAFYGISESKIDNVSCGIKSDLAPLTEQEVVQMRRKWTNGAPYFFFVGSMHPRKNIGRLIEAFNLFKASVSSDCKLVLAGSILWAKSDLERIYLHSPFRDDVVFTGRVTDRELNQLLGASMALSYVPLFEGFGLPIVEAFQTEVPVICSNLTSMPEVAGGAALLVDPYDINDIANAMIRIYENSALRMELVEKGKQQRKQFTWDRTAKLLWECLFKAAGSTASSSTLKYP
jgi:glycosyltransferase involved in cell wall biosynthesis